MIITSLNIPAARLAAACHAGSPGYLFADSETCRSLPALRGCDTGSYILVQQRYTPVQFRKAYLESTRAVGCRIGCMSSQDLPQAKVDRAPRLDRALLIAAEKVRIQYRNMPTAFVGVA